MNIRYRVESSQTERAGLIGLLAGGKHAVRKLKRAQILWAADAGVDDETIAKSVGVGGSTVYRTKRRFVEGNLEAALNESAPGRRNSRKERRFWSRPPAPPRQGRKRWTLELLAGESSSSMTACRRDHPPALGASPGAGTWVHPEVDGRSPMEDVLDLYAEGHDPKHPSYALMKARISLDRTQPILPAQAGNGTMTRIPAQWDG